MTKYQSLVEGKTNVLVFIKEGLTTQSLAHASKSYNFLKDKIYGNSYIYTNVN